MWRAGWGRTSTTSIWPVWVALLFVNQFALRLDQFVQLNKGLVGHAGALKHHGVRAGVNVHRFQFGDPEAPCLPRHALQVLRAGRKTARGLRLGFCPGVEFVYAALARVTLSDLAGGWFWFSAFHFDPIFSLISVDSGPLL
jgi:hypothetical protein